MPDIMDVLELKKTIATIQSDATRESLTTLVQFVCDMNDRIDALEQGDSDDE